MLNLRLRFLCFFFLFLNFLFAGGGGGKKKESDFIILLGCISNLINFQTCHGYFNKVARALLLHGMSQKIVFYVIMVDKEK